MSQKIFQKNLSKNRAKKPSKNLSKNLTKKSIKNFTVKYVKKSVQIYGFAKFSNQITL